MPNKAQVCFEGGKNGRHEAPLANEKAGAALSDFGLGTTKKPRRTCVVCFLFFLLLKMCRVGMHLRTGWGEEVAEEGWGMEPKWLLQKMSATPWNQDGIALVG